MSSTSAFFSRGLSRHFNTTFTPSSCKDIITEVNKVSSLIDNVINVLKQLEEELKKKLANLRGSNNLFLPVEQANLVHLIEYVLAEIPILKDQLTSLSNTLSLQSIKSSWTKQESKWTENPEIVEFLARLVVMISNGYVSTQLCNSESLPHSTVCSIARLPLPVAALFPFSKEFIPGSLAFSLRPPAVSDIFPMVPNDDNILSINKTHPEYKTKESNCSTVINTLTDLIGQFEPSTEGPTIEGFTLKQVLTALRDLLKAWLTPPPSGIPLPGSKFVTRREVALAQRVLDRCKGLRAAPGSALAKFKESIPALESMLTYIGQSSFIKLVSICYTLNPEKTKKAIAAIKTAWDALTPTQQASPTLGSLATALANYDSHTTPPQPPLYPNQFFPSSTTTVAPSSAIAFAAASGATPARGAAAAAAADERSSVAAGAAPSAS